MMWHSEEFITSLRVRGFASGTLRYSALYVRYFIDYARACTVHSADDVTPRLINDYHVFTRQAVGRKIGQPIAPRTALARLVVLRSYFEYLAKNKYILIDPTHHLTLPKQSSCLPAGIPREAEIQKLIELPDTTMPSGVRDRAILELMYSSGLRRQEVVNLNVCDIDLRQGVMRVNQGKNRKDRIVPLGKAACQRIELYLCSGRQNFLKKTKWQKAARNPVESAAFVSRHGGRMKAATLSYMVRGYMRRLFPGRQRLCCHALRHACATHMLRGGANLRYIQQLLGHSSLLTTELYTHLDITDLKTAHTRCHPSDRLRKEMLLTFGS